MTRRPSNKTAVARGRLYGAVAGLCLGLALWLAPAAWATQVNVNGTVYAVAADGLGGYYAGGSFTVASSSIVNAMHIKSDGTLDNNWSPNPNGTVRALAASGPRVYVGGTFATVRASASTTVTRNNAAAVDATSGYDTGWNPSPDNTVNALAVSGLTVYLGGLFSHVNASNSTTAARANAAAVDTANGYDTGWNPGPIGTVKALAVPPAGSPIYLGGDFSITSGGATLNKLARVNTSGTLDVGWNPAPDGAVNALALSGSTVYVGGSFNHITGQVIIGSPRHAAGVTVTRNFAAAVGTTTGLATPWDPNPSSAVNALAVSAATVYLGGSFNSIRSADGSVPVPRPNVAAVDMTHGYDTGWDATIGNTVNGLATWQSQVYLGGQSFSAGLTPQYNLTVAPVGGGNGTVTSSPSGIDCPVIICSQTLDNGSVVTLTATAALGSRFAGWSGAGCAGTAPCAVTLNSNTTVIPIFIAQHTLNVTDGGSGSGTVFGGGINCGSTCAQVWDAGTIVTLTALPSPGSTFAGWSGGGCSGTGACTVTLNADATVIASFAPQSTPPGPPTGTPPGPPTGTPPGPPTGTPPGPPTGTHPPKCTLRSQSSKILLAAPKKRKGKPRVAPGTLTLTVRCDRNAGVTLSAVITELVGKKPRHGKQRTKAFRLGPVRASVSANASKTLTLSLSRAALADLKHKSNMSVVLTLTPSGGAGRNTATIGHLTGA